MNWPPVASRAKSTIKPFLDRSLRYVRWLLFSAERHSISYTPSRAAEMAIAAALSVATRQSLEVSDALVCAIAADGALLDRLERRKALFGRSLAHDLPRGLGKHLFYAALISLVKPARICEFGTYLGYGTALLAYAAKSYGGQVLTVDNRVYEPRFFDDGDTNVRAVVADALDSESMSGLLAEGIDLMIWDVVRNVERERAAFDGAMRMGTRLICANWHASGALFEAAKAHGYHYLAVDVSSEGHWYPGTQLGFAYR